MVIPQNPRSLRYPIRKPMMRVGLPPSRPPPGPPSQMGLPSGSFPKKDNFFESKNFYILLAGVILILILIFVLVSVKNDNNSDDIPSNGNNTSEGDYQFADDNINNNIPADDENNVNDNSGSDYVTSNNFSLCEDGENRTCGLEVGVCEFGFQECLNGTWGLCLNFTGPFNETCSDGLDNNCNGVIDDVDFCGIENNEEIIFVDQGICGDGICGGFESAGISSSSAIVCGECTERVESCNQTQNINNQYNVNIVNGTKVSGISFELKDTCIDASYIRDYTCAINGGDYFTHSFLRNCNRGYTCRNGFCEKDICGDNICAKDETRSSCPKDCAVCGDNICDGPPTVYSTDPDKYPENPQTCSQDCYSCGDGLCHEQELLSCEADCQPYISQVARTSGSILAYYPFNEEQGTVVYDYSENGYDGKFLDGANRVEGIEGNACPVYGSGVAVDDAPVLWNGSSLESQFSVETWVKLTALNWTQTVFFIPQGWYVHPVSGNRTGAVTLDSLLVRFHGYTDDCLHVYLSQMNTSDSYPDITSTSCGPSYWMDGQWHHIAVTYDGGTLKLYVDGNLEGSAFRPGIVFPSEGILRIGSQYRGSGDPYPLKGHIDEFMIWDYAKTSFIQ